MMRGEIWMVDFGVPFGSEPGWRRPSIVVQNDEFNQSAMHTTIVIPLTSNLKKITCLATNTSATGCTTNWTFDVSSTGTFYKAAGFTWSTSSDGIPGSGWTVQDAP